MRRPFNYPLWLAIGNAVLAFCAMFDAAHGAQPVECSWRIRVPEGGGRSSCGSGTSVHPQAIITAAHVVSKAGAKCEAYRPTGERVHGTVVACNTSLDVAIIWTEETMPNFVAVAAADPAAGETVQAFGYGHKEILRTNTGKVLNGQASMLYCSIVCESGDSGGGLFNQAGELCGVICTVDSMGANGIAEGRVNTARGSSVRKLAAEWEAQYCGPEGCFPWNRGGGGRSPNNEKMIPVPPGTNPQPQPLPNNPPLAPLVPLGPRQQELEKLLSDKMDGIAKDLEGKINGAIAKGAEKLAEPIQKLPEAIGGTINDKIEKVEGRLQGTVTEKIDGLKGAIGQHVDGAVGRVTDKLPGVVSGVVDAASGSLRGYILAGAAIVGIPGFIVIPMLWVVQRRLKRRIEPALGNIFKGVINNRIETPPAASVCPVTAAPPATGVHDNCRFDPNAVRGNTPPVFVTPAVPIPDPIDRHHNQFVPVEAKRFDKAWAQAVAKVGERFPGAVPYLNMVERTKEQVLAGQSDPQL